MVLDGQASIYFSSGRILLIVGVLYENIDKSSTNNRIDNAEKVCLNSPNTIYIQKLQDDLNYLID